MPALVRPVADERDGLLAFLAQQRDALRFAVYGLTDEQARATPTVSSLNLAGLVKHLARVEQKWIVEIVAGRELPPEYAVRDWEAEFRLGEGETLQGALDHYEAVAAETESIIREIDDLGRPVPVPRGSPWFPADVEAWSVRWVLLQMIQETARHAGHADIIREALDGSNAFRLIARAEGWEAEFDRWQTAAPAE